MISAKIQKQKNHPQGAAEKGTRKAFIFKTARNLGQTHTIEQVYALFGDFSYWPPNPPQIVAARTDGIVMAYNIMAISGAFRTFRHLYTGRID